VSDAATLAAGVVGVGEMGRHHARVYGRLPSVDLVGVSDADDERARTVADRHGTRALDRDRLLSAADLVSVAVPTDHHADVATAALEAGVAPLVEKPLVRQPARGWDLVDRALEAGRPLATGHVERFNPAVRALGDVLPDLDLVGVGARRLGPPVERDLPDGVALDLMVHDVDLLRWLVERAGGDPDDVRVVGARDDGDGEYAAALLAIDGVVATLTASRRTRRKVRDLQVTADGCSITVDHTDRSVRVHHRSTPEFVADDGDLQYRHGSVTERPTVENGEPLAAELSAFVDAVRENRQPPVTGVDGVRAVEVALAVRRAAAADAREVWP
jgi:predicted dehydrogenase